MTDSEAQRVHLTDGRVVENVCRIATEATPLEDRIAWARTINRMRSRVDRRVHLHLVGGGYRVAYADEIERVERIHEPEAQIVTDGGTETDGIVTLAREYNRSVDELEAAREEFLVNCAEDFYDPGYLDDSEWERLKQAVHGGNHDTVMLVIELACYRKAATECGRAHEFDDDWPAKANGGPL